MASTKRLYRSNSDRILGGVCGGIAKRMDVDPTLVRIIFVIALFTSLSLIAYLVLWVIIPLKR